MVRRKQTQAQKEAQKRYQQKRLAQIKELKRLGQPLPPTLQKQQDSRRIYARGLYVRKTEEAKQTGLPMTKTLYRQRNGTTVLPLTLLARLSKTAAVKGIKRTQLVLEMIEYWYEKRGEFDDRR